MYVVHVTLIRSRMLRVALIFWSISSRWIRSSGIPRPEDLKLQNKKLEMSVLVSFCPTEAAAWCWYEAFGPHLVFLNRTSSRNVLKTCEESCILSSDAQWARCERKITEVDDILPTVFHRCSQQSCVLALSQGRNLELMNDYPVPWVLQGASKWNQTHCLQEAGTRAATNCRFVIRLRRPPPEHVEKTPAICNFTWSVQCQTGEPNWTPIRLIEALTNFNKFHMLLCAASVFIVFH